MKIDKILYQYVNGGHKYKRKIGRYWASDTGNIKKGYLTLDNFFEKKDIEIDGVKMILTGQSYEDTLTKIFRKMNVDFKAQEKKVMKLSEEVELVVKPDFVLPTFVIETKYPFSMIKPGTIPDRYLYQLECEYRAFNLPVYLGIFSSPFNVEFVEYHPSKRRWINIQKSILNFHEELKKKQEQEKILV